MTTFETIAKIIADQMHIDAADLTPETNLKTELKADSLDVASILFSIEDEFGIEVPTERALALDTMREVVDLIDSLKG